MKTYEEGFIKGFSRNINVVEELETKLDNANSKIKELSNRIFKAIEYINNVHCCTWDNTGAEDLLKILKGSENNEQKASK